MDAKRRRILLDPSAPHEARYEVVDDLSIEADSDDLPEWAGDDAVLDALTQIASSPDEDPNLLAAEALALVWVVQGRVDTARFHRLSDFAKQEVRGYFEASGLPLR